MKKIYVLLICIVSLLFSSCEEDFNPKTDFTEKYVLYGVIQNYPEAASPYVTLSAAILKTYDLEGFAPAADTTDRSLKDCEVTLTIGDRELPVPQVIRMRVAENFTPRYSYRISGFSVGSNQDVKIKAVLPNGKILTAHTKVPERLSELDFSYPFNNGIHTKLNRFLWGDSWIINWDSFDDYLFFPRLTLSYQVETDSGFVNKSREIPLRYTKNNGKFEPVYTSYTWEKQIEYSFECFDSVMTQISAGDTAKSKYTIFNISFGMIEYETNLASYFSSTNGYLDNFSIRLDESVYTNVSGGIGVFGANTVLGQTFKVEKDYVESFGYKRGVQ